MISLTNSALAQIVVHQVGNKYKGIPCSFSTEPLELSDLEYAAIYPRSFSFLEGSREVFSFHHSSSVTLNEMYHYSNELFIDSDKFLLLSQQIVTHLYEQSNQPNINVGEVIVVYLEDITIDEITTDAIAIIKCENRSSFFRTYQRNQQFRADVSEGIVPNKFDKACLIINVEQEKGFKVISMDKNDSTNYWERDFLHVQRVEDDYLKTKSVLSFTHEFVQTLSEEKRTIDKADKAVILNSAIDYFKSNADFEETSFAKQVLKKPSLINAFYAFRDQYAGSNNTSPIPSFAISSDAVKQQSKYFRKVIKLDKNFHLYIHGNSAMIEKGFDQKKGLNFYKIYFEDEF